jgi:hypothetical protein
VSFDIIHMQQLARNHPDFDLAVLFCSDVIVLRALHRTTKKAETHRLTYLEAERVTVDWLRIEFVCLIEIINTYMQEVDETNG